MVKKKYSNDKYQPINSELQLPDKDKELPLPSLEDVKDSQKEEFFTVENKNKDK
ncbi:MAG: hypothetical protein PWP31_1987 [Clostridia bacterium]|nr:hypothetical protein [Clostridia bacterium]